MRGWTSRTVRPGQRDRYRILALFVLAARLSILWPTVREYTVPVSMASGTNVVDIVSSQLGYERGFISLPASEVTGLARKLGKDAKVLFLQGASGNICQVNPLDGSRREVGVSWAKKMGKEIATHAFDLIKQRPAAVSGRIRVLNRTIRIPRRSVDPELFSWACKHKKQKTTEVPFLSNYGTEKYGQVPRSVMEFANGWNGYVPTPKAFGRSGGYETKELSTTMMVPEAGSMITKCVFDMLNSAKNRKMRAE